MTRTPAIGAVAVVLVAACHGASAPRLDVWFSGCREVTVDTECRVPSRETSTLTFWVEARDRQGVMVMLDGVPQPLDISHVQAGVRFKIAIARVPAVISVHRPEGEWHLRVTGTSESEVLGEADRLRRAGDFAAALAILEPMRMHPSLEIRARVLGLIGRIAHARGEPAQAIAELEHSIQMNRAAGFAWGEMDDRYALSFVKRIHGDYAGARSVLLGVRDVAASYSSGARWASYYEGYAAFGTTDLRRALALFDRVMIDAERLDLDDLWTGAAQMQLRTLIQLGRKAEARTLLAAVDEHIPEAPPCARADALEQTGMLTLDFRDDAATLRRADVLLREAVGLYRHACPMPRRLAATLVHLGSAALGANETNEAEVQLSASRAAYSEPSMLLLAAQVELEAKIAEQRRDRSAADRYHRLELLGLELDDPSIRWSGLVGRGRALEQLDRSSDAIEVYQEAEAVLDRLRFNAPLGGGRETFLGDRVESASRLIDLLSRSDRVQEAVQAARRSLARALSALAWPARLDAAPDDVRRAWYTAVSTYHQQRTSYELEAADDWKLPADRMARRRDERGRRDAAARALLDEALASLGARGEQTLAPLALLPGELVIIYHPIPSGWIGFAIDRDGATAHRLGALNAGVRQPDKLGETLLAPFSARLEHHDSVRFLPHGALAQIDFHALPWRGRPLIASMAVRYGVDVPSAGRAGTAMNAVVIDPHPELRTSRGEAARAEVRLAAGGWRVRRLSGAAATRRAINESIAAGDVGLLQYAGHASFAGLDGWESHLGVEDNRLLTVGDILALPAAPAYVVLSGCETAATAAAQGVSGLGLAQAFVVAGARWVVASTRPVKDLDASAIVAALDAEQALRSGADIAVHLRAAQNRLMEAAPAIDWASFRVIVP
jgi:tetratricopeptide (TPR) repeat protein